MAEYNGHESRHHWNVSLWLNNDESLYGMAREVASSFTDTKRAAACFVRMMGDFEMEKTPDGYAYTVETVEPVIAELMEEIEE